MVSVSKDNGLIFMRADDPLSPALISQWAPPTDLPPTGFRRVGGRSPSCSVSLSCTRRVATDETRRTQRSWLRVGTWRAGGRLMSTDREFSPCNSRSHRWPKTVVRAGYRLLYGGQVSPDAVVGPRGLGSSFACSPGVVTIGGLAEKPFLVPLKIATNTGKNASAAQGKSAVQKWTLAPLWLQTAGYPHTLGAGFHRLWELSGVSHPVKGETLAKRIAGGNAGEDWVGVEAAPTTQRTGASQSGQFRLGTHPGGGQARVDRTCVTMAGRTLSLQGPPGCGQRGPVMSWPAVELNVSTGQDVLALGRPSPSLNLEGQGGGLMGRGIVETPLLPSTLLRYAVWAQRPGGAYSVGWSDCRRTVPYATPVVARYTGYSTR